jgi:cell wall-associated NlpC family hydrolase
MTKRVTIAATVCTAALVAASFTTAAATGVFTDKPAQPELTAEKQETVKVPSAEEVKAAKVDPETKKALVKRIQSELDKTAENYRKINRRTEDTLAALGKVQQAALIRQQQLDEAKRQSEAAEAKLAASREKVGEVASSIYKNGSQKNSSLLLSKDPQADLDRAATDERIASSRNRDLKAAESDANLAGQWKDYHKAVKDEADKAAEAQAEAEQKQIEEAAQIKKQLEANEGDIEALLRRLAELQGVPYEKLKADYDAKQAEIQKAAEEKAAEEAKKQAEEEASAEKVAEFKRERAAALSVEGAEKPKDVVGPQDSSDGAQEEGASSDADKAAQEQAAKEAAQKEAAQKEAAEKQAEEEAAAQQKAAEEEAAKKAEAEKAAQEQEAAKKAEQDAAEKQAAAEQAAKDKADQDAAQKKADADAEAKAAADRKAAADKAAAKKAAEQKAAAERAAAQKAAQHKAAAERAAAQKAAQQKAAAERRAAAQKKAAAERAAAQRAAQQKAAKEAAAKRAAQKAAAEKAASQKPSVSGSSIVATGKSYIGTPYVWGQASPAGWDCLGFVSYVFKQHGYNINNSYASVLSAGTQVPYSQARPGDILYWPGHVAISLGGGQNVGAWNVGMGTRIGPDSWIAGTPTVIRVG